MEHSFLDIEFKNITEEKLNLIKPYQLSIGITPRCNSKCNYCVNWRDNKSLVPSVEQIIDIVNSAKLLGIKQILLSGGEPLTHPNWKEIVKKVKEIGLDILLITNGFLLDEAALKFLNENGCKKIGISIDILDKEKYFEIRGISNEKILNNIYGILNSFKSEQLDNISICCTVHKKNADELDDLLKFCLKHKLSIQFQPIQLDSIAPDNANNEYWPTKKQQEKLRSFFYKLAQLKKDGKRIANSLEYINNLSDYFCKGNYMPKKCYATFAQITIDQTLGLRPCWAMPEIGHVESGKDLIKLWNSQEMEDARNKAINHNCPGCYYCCHLSKKYNSL